MGMEALAHMADTVQEHGSDEDCISQTKVWDLLVRALYRHLQEAISRLPRPSRAARPPAKAARSSSRLSPA